MTTETSDEDRRNFLRNCGRFAASVPPTLTVLLSTSLTSEAIAKSAGGEVGRDLGAGKPGPRDSRPRRGGRRSRRAEA